MKNLRRTLAVLLTLAALAAVVVGVTYAWRDSRQHKSNEMGGGTGPRYEGRLVEEFDEVTDWKVSDGPVTKKIRVSNLGKSSDSFGDIYVRIQLKEYMEIGQASFKETEKRYMINETDGKFLVYGSEELARAAHPGHEVAQLYDAVVGVGGWFIETRAHDSNGQMGKYVITEITIGSATPVIGGSTRAVNLNHHGHPSDECNYPVHAWNGTTLATTQYVEWHLNDAKIMKLSDWLAAGSPEVDMWIIDDMSNSGWVYWGRVLHTDGDITADFMRSVSLKEQPEGSFYYVIHVELEAVSHDELSNWGNVGDGLGQHRPGPTNPPQETPAPTPDPGATPTPVPTSSPPPPPGAPDLPLPKGGRGPFAPPRGGGG
ncbi:MAG: hypothetical protein FWF10_05135, partial [Clostridiales bacterium]|nr:hypothetical protein [Clostridiales bacterium]